MAIPTTPTLALAKLTTTSLRATVSGGDEPNTSRLYYRGTTESAWTVATRSGNGTIDVTDLTEGATYQAVCCTDDGADGVSYPSELQSVTLTTDAETPAGIVSEPLHAAAVLIANTASFQGWVGAVNEAEALARIYEVSEPDTGIVYPHALVYQAEAWRAHGGAGGSRVAFTHEGAIGVRFVASIDATDTHRDAEIEFTNVVGSIIRQVELLAGSGGYLHVVDIDKYGGPERDATARKKDVNGADVLEQWIDFDFEWRG